MTSSPRSILFQVPGLQSILYRPFSIKPFTCWATSTWRVRGNQCSHLGLYKTQNLTTVTRFLFQLCESRSVMSNSLWPHGLYNPWNSPGQNTGVGSLSLLQGIFPTQGSNPGLLHCRQVLYQLSHKGSPLVLYVPKCAISFPGGSVVKNPSVKQVMQVQSLDQEDSLEKEVATHSNVLAWEISWTEEPGRLQSMGSQKSWTWLSS